MVRACAALRPFIRKAPLVIETLQNALTKRGYTTLTQVQTAVSDPDLIGADMLVSAQTGSGKTVGFGLAIGPTILPEGGSFGPAGAPLALVIAPTRELALQVKRELAWLYADAGGRLASCVGGMDVRDEVRALQRGAHIVIATPGRLRDHMERGRLDLSALRAVVLDEADEMLDLGFRDDLEFILEQTPETRQTLLFSATVPKSIMGLAKRYQRDAVRVTTLSEKSAHGDIDYRAMVVAPRDGDNAIINVLRYYEAPNAIVFCNTRAMVARLTTRLSNRGFSVVSLSGELTQQERSGALQAMRDGRARICVATDVAARGIDLPKLDLVIHAELPTNSETMLHRSGRTGRAGRKGTSALIVPPQARRLAERLVRFAKVDATWGPAPSAAEVSARDEERILADPIWDEAVTESEAGLVATLAERYSQEQLAAAYLRMFHTHHAAPEDLTPFSVEPPKSRVREEFGASTWFSLSQGRKDGADPRRLLPMLCTAGGIDRDDIGAIRIQPNETYIELRDVCVPDFLTAIGDDGIIEDHRITKLDQPPKLPQKRERFEKGPRKPHRKGGPRDRFDDGDAPRPRHNAGGPGPKPAAKSAPKTAKVWSHEGGDDAKPKGKPFKGGKPFDGPKGDAGDAPRKPRHKAGPGAGKPAGKPSGKPSGKPGGKPSGKPGGKPAGKPFGGKPGGPKKAGPGKGKPDGKPRPAKRAPQGGEAPPRRKPS